MNGDMITVILQPIGAVDPEMIAYLEEEMESVYVAVEVRQAVKVPAEASDPERGQLEGTSVLMALPSPDTSIDATLGVIDEDLFVAELNFIFGLAYGNRAIISLRRLRQEFHGLSPDPELFRVRAKKEAFHDLGHVFGLPHCEDRRCVMCFSNSIFETDFKSFRFCERCWETLEDSGVVLSYRIDD
jgi:archaemetzincin